jgi:serine/threonine protein kinase
LPGASASRLFSGAAEWAKSTRFRREITLARQVTHPNVCRVFDVGRGLVNGRERMFLTMEYLGGETLSQCLARQRTGSAKMPADRALALVKQLAAGLDALHQRGIVHRDLKPGNVMLVEESRLVITDFGLAREVSDEAEPLTEPQGMVGTPAYMAPEQLMGAAASPASDLYAFGLVAFEIATGLRFPAEAELPKGWEGPLRRCLDRAPEARPKSAGEAVSLMGASAAATSRRSRRWIPAALLAGALAVGAVAVRFLPVTPRHAAADPSDSVRELLIRYDKPGNTDLAISQIEKALVNGPGDRAAVMHYQLGLAHYGIRVNGRETRSGSPLSGPRTLTRGTS